MSYACYDRRDGRKEKENGCFMNSQDNDTLIETSRTGSGIDSIVFKAGINPGNRQVKCVGNDLVFQVAGANTLTVRERFSFSAASANEDEFQLRRWA